MKDRFQAVLFLSCETFLLLGNQCTDRIPDFITPLFGQGREWEDGNLRCLLHTQSFPDQFELLWQLVACDLICFGRNDHRLVSICLDPVKHFLVTVFDFVTDIDQKKDSL